MNNIYFVGTAGSGKSTMVGAFKRWLEDNEIDSVVINLDPGAEKLPYVPDIDIREWINLDDVMSQCGLGPNGAQVAAADLMAVNINRITDALDSFDTDYVLIDTPGQLELFAFRESSQTVMDALGRQRSIIAYLSDPTLYRSANGFVSAMTLASLVQFRMNVPIINLLSKSDVLKDEESARILDWYNNPDSLYGNLLDEDKDPESVMGMELFRALEDAGIFGEMRSVSSETGAGLPEIYAAVQLLGKAAILVPSPNVAEDHQTKNARALSDKDAALLVPDADAASSLVTTMLELATDSARIEKLSRNVKAMALRDAAEHIVDEVEKIIDRNQN